MAEQLVDTKRTYFQCDCDNDNHVKDAMERWADKLDNTKVLEDTATMIITVDGSEAHCQCVYCGYDKRVDVGLRTLPVQQHGKGFHIVGKYPDGKDAI
jgi:hypothetical protein